MKVGAATYEEYIKELQRKAGNDARHLDVAGVCQIANKTVLEMGVFDEESKRWQAPLEWSAKLQVFNDLLQGWTLAHRRLENMRDQIHRVVCDGKADNSDKKSRITNKRPR